MRSSLRSASLALCASTTIALASSSLALAAPNGEIDWTGPVAAGDTLTVDNPHGSIAVRPSSDGSASIRAAVTSPNDGDTNDVSLAATAVPGGVAVCTALPDAQIACGGDRAAERAAAESSKYRVDETIFVPQGVRVAVRGIDGTITIDGAPASVDASTIDGDIHVSARGDIAAETTNGSIYAALSVPSSNLKPMLFHTHAGSIRITAPSGAPLVVKAFAPNGSVNAAFPVVGSLASAAGGAIDAEADAGSISVLART